MKHSITAITLIILIPCLLLSCNLTRNDYTDVLQPVSDPSDKVSTVPEPIESDKINPVTTPQPTDISEASENDPETTAFPTDNMDPSDETDTEETNFPSSLRLCLLGDIMCLSGQQNAAKLSDGSHDYTGNYSLLLPFFDTCDYIVGNLETCVSPSSPYSAQSKNIDGNPNCNAPSDLIDSLTQVGITHLVTANNHCLDAGTVGITETLNTLDAAGIVHTGTHTPEQAGYSDSDYMLIRSGNFCIAVISVTELINRRSIVPAEDMHLYVNEYSSSFISSKIAAAREEGASYVIVYEHWGSENTHEVRSYQREHAQIIAEAGADLIIGSHSHCVQPMEIIRTSDLREVPCYFSLGNLVSSMAKEINHDTVLVELVLSCETVKTNPVITAEITSHPCHMLWSLNGNSFVITPVDYDTGSSSNNNTLSSAKDRIWAVLEDRWENEIEPAE